MRPRLKKWLRRLTLAVVLLAVLSVAAFTWLAYWPLEGDAGDLLLYVPDDVEFVVRGSYDDLMATGWIQQNVEEQPVHPAVADWRNAEGAFRAPEARRGSLPGLRQEVETLEAQINQQIPLDAEWARFGFAKDILAGEAVIAGRWCAALDPRAGPPSWQELLILKRVSWRPRLALATLDHAFIRERVGGGGIRSIEDLGDGIFKLVLADVRVSNERERAGCGRGFIMPPENEWYVRRVRDVLAIANTEALMRKVADLAKDESGVRSFARRPGFELARSSTGIVAAANLEPLDGYLIRWMERRRDRLAVLERFVRPSSLHKLNGSLDLRSPDVLRLGGASTYSLKAMGPAVRAMYSLPARPVNEGISGMVPAADTFAAAFLHCDPQYLLQSIYEEALDPEERRLWLGNLQAMRRRGESSYATVDEFLADVAGRVGETSTVAFGRLSSAYDRYEHQEYFSSDPPAMMAFALMMKLREGLNHDEVDVFLREKVPLLGFDSTFERATYKNFAYTAVELPAKNMNERHLSPAWSVLNGHIILTNSRDYLEQIIDVVASNGQGALEADPSFRETLRHLPDSGHAALYVDLEKLTRVPPSSAPGAQPRGFLWDARNEHVLDLYDERAIAIEARTKAAAKHPQPLSVENGRLVDAEVDRAVESLFARYPDYIEEYRQELLALRRLRTFGFVVRAIEDPFAGSERGALDLRSVVLFRQRD